MLEANHGQEYGHSIVREDECQVPGLFEYGAECCDGLLCLLCSLNFFVARSRAAINTCD